VLSVRPKITDLNFHLFARPLHPELFQVCASRTFEREQYSLSINISTDGHFITFRHKDFTLTEVSASLHHPLPPSRIVVSHPVEAPHAESIIHHDSIEYQSEVEMEAVSPQTFVTIAQQLDKRIECEGLVHRFDSNGRLAFGAISYINVQSFREHVKIRSFHTFPDTCAVMKSESQFKLLIQ
jgi:hypothetical protein